MLQHQRPPHRPRQASEGLGLRIGGVLALLLPWNSSRVLAQAPNDNVEHRRVLKLNETIASTTVGCTVQRGCVDERLTGKCIQYHNDQWFEVTPSVSGRYFVNIGSQKCRDVRGVQLVVLTGTACQTSSYRVLSCTSLGSQDDVFVTLDSLQAGQPYLLNIDGYLHDYCRFTLAVSDTPAGQPLTPPVAASTAVLAGQVATLTWQLPDSVAATRFAVVRREGRQFRSEPVGRVEARRNVSGQWVRTYTLHDTLPAVSNWSRFEYRIFAQIDAGPDVVIGNPVVNLKPIPGAGRLPGGLAQQVAAPAAKPVSTVTLPLAAYPGGASLSVLVTNTATGQVLKSVQFIRAQNVESQNRLAISRFKDQGITHITVRITHHNGSRRQSARQLTFLL